MKALRLVPLLVLSFASGMIEKSLRDPAAPIGEVAPALGQPKLGFSLENRLLSSFTSGGGQGRFESLYLAGIGYRFTPEWSTKLWLGMDLLGWKTGDAGMRVDASLSLSNLKGLRLEYAGKDRNRFWVTVGQEGDDFSRLRFRSFDGDAEGPLWPRDSLRAGFRTRLGDAVSLTVEAGVTGLGLP